MADYFILIHLKGSISGGKNTFKQNIHLLDTEYSNCACINGIKIRSAGPIFCLSNKKSNYKLGLSCAKLSTAELATNWLGAS